MRTKNQYKTQTLEHDVYCLIDNARLREATWFTLSHVRATGMNEYTA